jgi:hypothetical protein
MEQKHGLTRRRLEEMEERFRNRESRKEDVERIHELELVVSRQQAVVDQTIEELKFYKLELLNREENYNQRFGRSPNVGIMNVLPSKSKKSQQSANHSLRNSSSVKRFPPLAPGQQGVVGSLAARRK